jgi:hypothetical protein
MSKDIRAQVAQQVATALFTGEAALEQALAETATMIAALPAARSAAGLSVLHGQQALEDGMELAQLLTQARRKMGELHKTLEATGRQVGVRTQAFGDVPKPPMSALGGEAPRLVAVGES